MAVVVAEHLFVEVAEQVELFNRNISALELALQKTPEVFESVGVNLSVNVPLRMVNDLVLEPMILESHVGHERIGIDGAACFDVSADVGLECVLFAIANDRSANLSTTFEHAHDGHLVFSASLGNPALTLGSVHESRSTANESFVYFHFATSSTHWNGVLGLHGESDSVEHEPCGLLSDSQSAANFIAADSVLAVRYEPNSDKPLVERQSGILEDSSNLHAELLASVLVLALPEATGSEKANVLRATSRALNTVRPAALNHKGEAVVRIGEVLDGGLQSLWLVHGVSHWSKYPRNALLSQRLCKPPSSTSPILTTASPLWR